MGVRPSIARGHTAAFRTAGLVTDEERTRLVQIIAAARTNTQDDRSDDNLRAILAALRND